MKSPIVADGEWRWRRSPEFQAQLTALRVSIQERHREAMARAGFIGRLRLRMKMSRDFRRELRQLVPSPYSSYASRNPLSR
jgi:hypothetical protein